MCLYILFSYFKKIRKSLESKVSTKKSLLEVKQTIRVEVFARKRVSGRAQFPKRESLMMSWSKAIEVTNGRILQERVLFLLVDRSLSFLLVETFIPGTLTQSRFKEKGEEFMTERAVRSEAATTHSIQYLFFLFYMLFRNSKLVSARRSNIQFLVRWTDHS